ncbi:MAG: DNA mismatch repair endonuclease MutL [Bacteriovorax sp.]|jgi:DNA mismatch repair protein MutL
MNKDTTPPKIEILPEHIIDQIKAGEVLERPASLIKELIENSLDAGSTKINIHLVENGLDLLSIEDNGHGMSFDTLPFAFLRHATSKLKNFEDLYQLQSFGFRGEALASVAASARLTCTTQPTDLGGEGGKIIIHGGSQELLIPYRSSAHGTSLYIKDLFYNTPARLKFIKSKVSEKSALKKMLYAFILSNPQTTFSIKWDEKEREIFKETATCNRVEQVFFNKTSKDTGSLLWSASEEYENYRIEVYFSPTTHSTPQFRHHYLFVNNRYFQDKSLHQSILRTLEPLWRFGESGHYMVKINVPAEEIDVNVHPNKTQVKFLKSDIIYSLLVTSLKSAMKANAATLLQTENYSTSNPQNQFFTREENQTFDLLNMGSNQIQTEFHSSPAERTEHSPVIGYISPAIVLVKLHDRFFVANIKNIIAAFVSDSLQAFVDNDELSGPLLISEPFKIPAGKIDDHFDELKNLGFDLDRLNSEVIALRTLPRFVPQALCRDITTCLIQYINQAKVKNFNAKDFKTYMEENWPATSPLASHNLLNFLNNNSILNSGVLVELSEKNIQRIL